MTETHEGPWTAPTGQGWLGRNAWLLAAVWLMFLVFPLLAILTNEGNGTAVRIASTVLFIAFAAVYLDGFRRQHRREQQGLLAPGNPGEHSNGNDTAAAAAGPAESTAAGWTAAGHAHFVALTALTLALMMVAGVGGVGVVVFVVVFAVFHFPWPVVSVVFAAGLGVTIGAPLLAGRLADLWSLALILIAVSGAAVLVRLFQGYQFDQAHLRMRLAIGDERTRVARDVHDVLGHSVTAVILKVELCQRLLEQVDAGSEVSRVRIDECRNQLADLESISRSALAEIRSTVGGLRATNLSDELTAARSVLADAGVDLLVTGDVNEIPEGHRPMLAWVVREAVTNIIRHANAEHCHVELASGRERGEVVLRITDDGIGLGTAEEGNGLRGLRERVAASGAHLSMETATLKPADASDSDRTRSSSVAKAAGTRIEVSL